MQCAARVRLWGPAAWALRAPLGSPLRMRHSFPLEAQVPRDVLLFQHDRRRFFRVLGLFCAGQFAFWTFLAHFAFHSLRAPKQEPGERRPAPALPGGAALDLRGDKWRFGFSASCLTLGCLIVAAGFAFSRRSVGRVVLHRGGREVTLSTYYPFGLTSSFSVPLRHVSCASHRAEVPAWIPLKVKGRPFYFLLDKQGQVTNAQLFDITVGAYRKL